MWILPFQLLILFNHKKKAKKLNPQSPYLNRTKLLQKVSLFYIPAKNFKY